MWRAGVAWRLVAAATVLSTVAVAEDAPAAVEKKPEPKKPSTLAPTISYLDLWAFVYGKDTTLPKVLYVPRPPEEGESEDEEPPSWLTSAAMAYKERRQYTAKFAVVASKDAGLLATRFGIPVADLPVLLGCHVADDASSGTAFKLPATEIRVGGGAAARAAKAFVSSLVAKELDEASEGAMALPSLPEPTRPRKQASASIEEFDHDSLPLNCYDGRRPLCVLAILPQPHGQGCPSSVGELARKFKNDKTVAFGCVGASRQVEFLRGFGLGISELPALVAVKGGKRPRQARMEADSKLDAVAPMSAFVDSLLGGGATFKKLADGLPELEASYLLDAEEAVGTKDEV